MHAPNRKRSKLPKLWLSLVAVIVFFVCLSSQAVLPSITIVRDGTNILVNFSGRLQSAPTGNGTFTDVPGETNRIQLSPMGEGRLFWRSAVDIIPVETNTTLRSIAAGGGQVMAIRRDSTLWGWGNGQFGQLGALDTNTVIPTPKQAATVLTNWVGLAAGKDHTLGIRQNGSIWSWGHNQYGQLGNGSSPSPVFPSSLFPLNIGTSTNWHSIAAGENHSLAIARNGTLWTWGLNDHGQLGDGSATNHEAPFQIGNATNWFAAAGGSGHTIAITKSGILWTWGANASGQLGDGTTNDQSSPIQISGFSDWTAVAAGRAHSVGLRQNGSLWSWGDNSNGQLGTGSSSPSTLPIQVGTNSNWSFISAGERHTVAIRQDGTLWAWGLNSDGQLGDGTFTQRNSPIQIGTNTTWVIAAAGNNFTVAETQDRRLWCFGNNDHGQLGSGTQSGSRSIPMRIVPTFSWSAIGAGASYTMAVRADGTLWAWGYNNYGQLIPFYSGSPSISPYPPFQLGTNDNWSTVTCGYDHSAGIRNDGSLWVWGYPYKSTVASPLINIGAAATWKTVALGTYKNVILRQDGTLWNFGSDRFNSDSTNVIQLGAATNWTDVVSLPNVGGNSDHNLALSSDGRLWAWGINNSGVLGNGTTANIIDPQQIAPDSRWLAIATGLSHSLAIRDDHTLWAWGANGDSQDGDGTQTQQLSPVQIGNSSNWVSVSCGWKHSIGLQSNGSAWGWGTTMGSVIPTQIGDSFNWSKLVAGALHTVGLQKDGSLWTWGVNSRGELGVPSIPVPQSIQGTNWGAPPIQ